MKYKRGSGGLGRGPTGELWCKIWYNVYMVHFTICIIQDTRYKHHQPTGGLGWCNTCFALSVRLVRFNWSTRDLVWAPGQLWGLVIHTVYGIHHMTLLVRDVLYICIWLWVLVLMSFGGMCFSHPQNVQYFCRE